MFETPNYIKSLLVPSAKAQKRSRRIWSIDLETVWLPFFHASNANGDTAMPSEALGCPMRLAVSKDGRVKFSDSGVPVVRVVKDISDMVKLIRDNFTAGLTAYTNGVASNNPDAYNAEVKKAIEAGKPLIAHDLAILAKIEAEAKEEAEAEAKEEAEAEAEKTPEKTPELVAV